MQIIFLSNQQRFLKLLKLEYRKLTLMGVQRNKKKTLKGNLKRRIRSSKSIYSFASAILHVGIFFFFFLKKSR